MNEKDTTRDPGTHVNNKSLDKVVGPDVEFFRNQENPGQMLVRMQIGKRKEVLTLDDPKTHAALKGAYQAGDRGQPMSLSAIKSWLQEKGMEAFFQNADRRVAVRTAQIGDKHYIDLANVSGEVVEVDAAGWRIITDCPVYFRRPDTMLPLPTPVEGGSIDDLRKLVNVPDDDQWLLLISWTLAALLAKGPYAVLFVAGEPGSGKTTLFQFLMSLIDPNALPIRAMPTSERDMLAVATNRQVLAFDNLSRVTREMSDTLCRLSTGTGISVTSPYSGREESVALLRRPVAFNGIEDVVLESDLLDRSITLTLPAIADKDRRTMEELSMTMATRGPAIFGAMLTVLHKALANLSSVTEERLPRMADFATLAIAAEEPLGYRPGSFLKAFNDNRGMNDRVVIRSSVLGAAIEQFMLLLPESSWSGSATQLLKALTGVDNRVLTASTGAADPTRLSNKLRRLAPNLRRFGIEVGFNRDASERKLSLLWNRPVSKLERGRATGLLRDADDANDANRENAA